jgi:hypothetical protein
MAVDTERIMKVGLELAGWKKMPADSAVHVKGRNIKKVLIAIDVGTAELMLARQLGCDAVIAHHPIGTASVNFYKVFDRHVDFMVEHGVPKRLPGKQSRSSRSGWLRATTPTFTATSSGLQRRLACRLSISTSPATNTCGR